MSIMKIMQDTVEQDEINDDIQHYKGEDEEDIESEKLMLSMIGNKVPKFENTTFNE